MLKTFLSNLIVPNWVKPVAITLLASSLFGVGYVKGLQSGYDKAEEQRVVDTKIIIKRGEVTTKVVTKYIQKEQEIKSTEEELKKEGEGYAIKFPDGNYIFSDEFISLYNRSLTD